MDSWTNGSPLIGERDVTEETRTALRNVLNPDLRKQAETILGLLRYTMANLDSSDFPIVRIAGIHDELLELEWGFPHRRIAFIFKPKKEESEWFCVSDETLDSIGAKGLLSESLLTWLIPWLVSYVTRK